MTDKIVIDCVTGEETRVPLTADEEAQRQADAAAEADRVDEITEAARRRDDALAELEKATSVAQIRSALIDILS